MEGAFDSGASGPCLQAGSPSRRRFLKSVTTFGLSWAAWPAHAASGRVLFGLQPSRLTATVVDPVLAALQGRYQPDLGTKLVFMPGNSGAVALDAMRRAPADGGTALVSASSFMTLLPHLRAEKVFDPYEDVAPVASLGDFTLAFVVGRAVPARVTTALDYLAWVKQNPMLASYGVPGLGTGAHFLGAEVARNSGVLLKATPYKGVFSMTDDLAAGTVSAAITPLPNAVEAVRSSQLRVLAVSSEQRWPGHADLPTLLELGLATYPVVESSGLFMMKSVPATKIRALGQAVESAMATDAIRSALVAAAFRPTATTCETHAASLAEERASWLARIKATGFSMDS